MLQYACYRLGCLEDAEDVVQNVFLRLNKVESGRVEIDVQNPKGYIYRTLANLCSSFLRNESKQNRLPLNDVEDFAEEEPQNFEQEFNKINRLLSEIPEEQAEVIRLRIYSDLSFQEIAESVQIPLATAKSRFLYGITKIRKEISLHESSSKNR